MTLGDMDLDQKLQQRGARTGRVVGFGFRFGAKASLRNSSKAQVPLLNDL